MRFLNGFWAVVIWSLVVAWMKAKGVEVSNDASLISLAVVAAGAMAGGD